MSREDKPEDLKELIETAIKIDNRYYERALEKKGYYDVGKSSRPGQGGRRGQYYSPYMELDATERKKLSSEEKQKHK